LVRKGLSPLTVRKSGAMLSAAFNQAFKRGWIDRNPAERASPPGIRPKDIIPPTPEEIRLLWTPASDASRAADGSQTCLP
jgi:hypothetical protein